MRASWLTLAGGAVALATAQPALAGSGSLTSLDTATGAGVVSLQLSSTSDAGGAPNLAVSGASDATLINAITPSPTQSLIRAASSSDPIVGDSSPGDLMDDRLKLENEEPRIIGGDDENRRTGGAPPLDDAGMPRVSAVPLPTPVTLGGAGLLALLLVRRRR